MLRMKLRQNLSTKLTHDNSVTKCSVKSLVESLSEHDISNSDELSKLGYFTLVIVCIHL